MEEGHRAALFDLADKIALHLIYNLTEAEPNNRLTAKEALQHHPWFFTNDKIIGFLKKLEAFLSSSNTDATIKKTIEESRHLVDSGCDWRRHLSKEDANDFGISLSEQLRFLLKALGHSVENNKKSVALTFNKSYQSTAKIIEYLVTGENALYSSFFMHMYSKAAELFPKSCGLTDIEASKKISRSYNNYLADIKAKRVDPLKLHQAEERNQNNRSEELEHIPRNSSANKDSIFSRFNFRKKGTR